MNTLDLSAYGVSEMNKEEMVETDGGSLLGLGIVIGLALLLKGCTVIIGDGNTVNKCTHVEADVEADVQL